MKKYKCRSCGHVFEGDLSTTECPIPGCKSSDIEVQKGPVISKKMLWVIIPVCLILFVLWVIPSGKLAISVKQFAVEGYVNLTIDGYSDGYSGKISVKVERDGEFYKNIELSDKVTRIDLPTGCYTFYVSFLDNRKNPEIKQFAEKICFGGEDGEVGPAPPSIKDIKQIDDCKTKKWKVVIIAKSIGNSSLQYSVDNGKTYSDNNQFNLNPGVYDVMVKDEEDLTDSRQIVLGKILCPENNVTKAEIQSWLDRLAQGDDKARADFSKYFVPEAKAQGVENVNTAYQLMIEIITTGKSVHISSLVLNGTRVSSITVN